MPGSMYIELALAFISAVRPAHAGPVCLQDVTFPNALPLQASFEINLKLKLEEREREQYLFTCEDAETETLCASLRIGPKLAGAISWERQAIRRTACEETTASVLYSELREKGNEYGPGMQAITRLCREPGCAWAEVTAFDDVSPRRNFRLDPVLLDGAIQSLAAACDGQDAPFVLTEIKQVRVSGPLSGGGYSLHAVLDKRPGPDDTTAIGRVIIFDDTDNVAVDLSGVSLRYLEPVTSRRAAQPGPKIPLVISATFTAEPVEESLVFWGQELDKPFDVQFGPYNQVFQQLLDPSSLLRRNREGANVVLWRGQDWDRGWGGVSLRQDQARIDESLAEHARRVLPNGLEIAHLNQYETDYLFKEIFVDRTYLRHGIEVKNGDCVFDIGANIGLFTLFVQNECKNTTVYAFEPSPPVFQLLKANAGLYGSDVHVFECGISNAASQAEFTFYEKSSVFSSFNADNEEDEAAVRAVVRNIVSEYQITAEEDLDKAVEELMAGRMDSRSFTCRLRSISEVIEEQGIDQIDLLKIDAEKSELAILKGIEDEDWPKIRQLVIEVHDRKGAVVRSVEGLLRSKGFELTLEEEPMLRGSGLFTIYAIREEAGKDKRAAHTDASCQAKLEATTLEFISALRSASANSSVPFIVISCPPTPTSSDTRINDISREMERLLAKELGEASNVHLVTSDQLLSLFPVDGFFDPDGDRLGHVPYTSEFYCALGTHIARKLDMTRRKSYKIIALDCDNTLWGGVCGEDGPHGLDLGEPWRQLQEFMVAQQERGMLLCLCSKNAEEDVFSVFEERSEMPLRRKHFVDHRINWASKSENLAAMAGQLNLGLDSFIFIDDNAVECAEVRAHCPEVLTLQLPGDPKEIPSYLEHVWAFDKAKITAEDQARTRLYREDRRRERLRTETLSLKEFFAGLGLQIRISAPHDDQLARVAQLTLRTNQFNITTIRRPEAEVRSLLKDDALTCLVVEVSDRFGDYGLVGVVFFVQERDRLKVDTFLLSCRVLGRGVEHQVVAELGEAALRRGCSTVDLPFIPTAKNAPALNFLRTVGADFESDQGGRPVFSFPAHAARAVTYDPDEAQSLANGEEAAATRVKPASSAGGAAPIDYHRIAEACRTPASILRAMEATRVRGSEMPVEGYVEPANDRERSIARIWGQVLGVAKVSAEHTFKELGGDSLKSVMILAQLKRELNINLAITDLFEYPTVRAMAKMLDASRQGATEDRNNPAGSQRGSRMRQRKAARRRAVRD